MDADFRYIQYVDDGNVRNCLWALKEENEKLAARCDELEQKLSRISAAQSVSAGIPFRSRISTRPKR